MAVRTSHSVSIFITSAYDFWPGKNDELHFFSSFHHKSWKSCVSFRSMLFLNCTLIVFLCVLATGNKLSSVLPVFGRFARSSRSEIQGPRPASMTFSVLEQDWDQQIFDIVRPAQTRTRLGTNQPPKIFDHPGPSWDLQNNLWVMVRFLTDLT